MLRTISSEWILIDQNPIGDLPAVRGQLAQDTRLLSPQKNRSQAPPMMIHRKINLPSSLREWSQGTTLPLLSVCFHLPKGPVALLGALLLLQPKMIREQLGVKRMMMNFRPTLDFFKKQIMTLSHIIPLVYKKQCFTILNAHGFRILGVQSFYVQINHCQLNPDDAIRQRRGQREPGRCSRRQGGKTWKMEEKKKRETVHR